VARFRPGSRSRTGGTALLLAALIATTALAQETAAPDGAAAAERGRQLFVQEQYAAALPELE